MTSITLELEDISEEAFRLLAGPLADLQTRLPNDFCDYCGEKIEMQIFRNTGFCCNDHREYEYWEEIFGETIA